MTYDLLNGIPVLVWDTASEEVIDNEIRRSLFFAADDGDATAGKALRDWYAENGVRLGFVYH